MLIQAFPFWSPYYATVIAGLVGRCLFVVNGYMKSSMALRTKGGRVVLIDAVSRLVSPGILWVFSGSLLLYVLLLLVFSNTEEVF